MDTHILIRWFFESRKLSRLQLRLLEAAVRRTEPIAFSAMSLLEIAILTSEGRLKLKTTIEEFFQELQGHPALRVLPLTYELAAEITGLPSLRDPADRVIVATARVHRLRLVTADQRIIESKLVAVVA